MSPLYCLLPIFSSSLDITLDIYVRGIICLTTISIIYQKARDNREQTTDRQAPNKDELLPRNPESKGPKDKAEGQGR